MSADRYELGASIGRGGMAEVFEGNAHGSHGFLRRVAIKRLLPEYGRDPHLVRMFLDEARTASFLHHSKIVAVLDFGVVDGCPFMVLELVEGWDAAKLVKMAQARGQEVPVDIALILATEIAHALSYAHARKDEAGRPLGIVHRDVKPSNILVSRSGDIKLGDFGIALARERSAVTTGFIARGTPGYMAPEQMFGRAVGPAADIFGVGISLHTMLTGDNPLMNDAQSPMLPTGELAVSPELPLDVREIIVRAVRISPEERHGSARELAVALGEALAPRLETDPTTRITQWLEELEAHPPMTQRITTAVLLPLPAPGQFALEETVGNATAPTIPPPAAPRGLPMAPPQASPSWPSPSARPSAAPSTPRGVSFPPMTPRPVSLAPNLAPGQQAPHVPARSPLRMVAILLLCAALLALVTFVASRSGIARSLPGH